MVRKISLPVGPAVGEMRRITTDHVVNKENIFNTIKTMISQSIFYSSKLLNYIFIFKNYFIMISNFIDLIEYNKIN